MLSLYEIKTRRESRYLLDIARENSGPYFTGGWNTKYTDILDSDVLEAALLRAMKNHRRREQYCKIEINKREVIADIQAKLIAKAYEPQPLEIFTVYEPKQREVQSPSIYDKIVQNAMLDNGLYEELTKPIIRDCYGSMRGRGALDGLERLTQFMAQCWSVNGIDAWVLKCDIRHYFASIQQEDITQIARRYVSDPDVMELLERYITICHTGLPLGLRTSQPLANLELSWLDHKVKEQRHCKWYGRYMDDFYVIHHDKEFLKELKHEMAEDLGRRGLEFNGKTQIFPVSNGIDFLGFRTYLNENGKVIRKLRDRSRRGMQRRIRQFETALLAGTMTKGEVISHYQAWRAHASHGNCRGLILMYDKAIKDMLKEVSDEPTLIKLS